MKTHIILLAQPKSMRIIIEPLSESSGTDQFRTPTPTSHPKRRMDFDNWPRIRGWSDLLLRHPNPFHNLTLLRITYPCGVQPIGQLIGRPSWVMPHECCRVVLRNPCALTLCIEPLAHGMVPKSGPNKWFRANSTSAWFSNSETLRQLPVWSFNSDCID